MRLTTIASSIRDGLLRMNEDHKRVEQFYNQYIVRMEDIMTRLPHSIKHSETAMPEGNHSKAIREKSPAVRNHIQKPSQQSMEYLVPIESRMVSHGRPALHHCMCRCHRRYFKRSSRLIDQLFGNLYMTYSGIPWLSPQCDLSNCMQSCFISDYLVSIIYLFPAWLLSWSIVLIFKGYTPGFDHSLRVNYHVPYSSLIMQYAYHGNLAEIKTILESRLASPFDITLSPRRSPLTVRSSLA